ncbi:MAG: hypothetical protein HYY24_12390 [Verrucomicrobia bacterium]|nr:hypothetical protein [Verrucomicrobiota bacterium]
MKTQQRIHSPFSPWLGATLLLAALLTNAWAQAQTVTLTPKGSYAGFDAYDVQVAGRYAYVAAANRLLVTDVGDPSQPQLVGSVSGPVLGSCGAFAVRVVGDYAYVGASCGGLVVLDVKDPTQPRAVGTNEAFAYYVRVEGHYAYVTSEGGGMHIIDVSDPAHPVRVGSYNPDGLVRPEYVLGKYAYARVEGSGGGGDSGLEVIDVSDPSNPVRVGSYAGWFPMDVVGNYGYLIGGGALGIIDLSNPSNPVLVGTYRTGGNVAALRVVGSYAYMNVYGDFGERLEVVDVTDPAHPQAVGRRTLSSFPFVVSLEVVGNTVYVGGILNKGLLIYEASTPAPAVLRFNPPLRSGDKLNLSWNGGAGIKLQTTPSLTAPNWQDVPGTDGASSIELPLTDPSAFFRVVKP